MIKEVSIFKKIKNKVTLIHICTPKSLSIVIFRGISGIYISWTVTTLVRHLGKENVRAWSASV